MRKTILAALVLVGLLLLIACKGTAGPQGSAGPAGSTGPAGATGAVGPRGPQGPAAPGTDMGMNVTVELSKPANGTHLVAGEKPVVTVTLKDKFGASLSKDDFATLNLYMYGPQETTKTVSAVKLLNATTDRTKTPHHYIDLLKDTNVQVSGNVLKYTLQAVSNEEPGTYTASLWVVKKGDPPVNQAFVLADIQIGTATAEKQIVEKEKCAACHLGADNGQFYFHHVDPYRSPYGSPSIDSIPVRTCKSCHNNEGYAAYTMPDGKTKISDPIVFRVHGVHYGEELTNPLNIDPKTGLFKTPEDYTSVIFPANAKNCNACHVDDRWKTKPSRLACGACHDAIDWATGKSVVKGKPDHAGGPQANDSACATCHPADTGGVKPISEAHVVKQPMNKIDVSLTAPKNGKFYVAGEKPAVTLVIRDDKGNPIDHTRVTEDNFSTAGLFVYGPRENAVPVLTNVAKNGNSKSRATVTSSIPAAGTPTKGWTFVTGDTFKISVNRGPVQELAAPVGLQTPTQVVDWLKANLKDVTVSANAAGNVVLLSNIQGDNSRFEIYNSPVTAKMGWKTVGLDIIRHGQVVGKTGTTMEPYVVIGAPTFPINDLRPRKDPLNYTDPDVKRTAGNITYPLDDVASLKPGTYMIYTYVLPVAGKDPNYTQKTGIGFLTFQVGTETPEKKVATNCTDCHGNTIWHLDAGPIHAEPFDTDYCLACHDYARGGTGEGFPRVGGTSTSGWAGYGAKPISARVHGVHRGAYLDRAEEIYGNNPNEFAEIIFPQDIRNCGKCHDPKTTTAAWKEEPSRLACLACHDSDSARAHGALNTRLPTPSYDPYGVNAVETCKTCHGAGREFSPDKVHNISKPYKPPYPRE